MRRIPPNHGGVEGPYPPEVVNHELTTQPRRCKTLYEPRSCPPSPSPRYDDVFQQGTQWLDDLGGQPLNELKGELVVSPDVWKSRTRSEPDVP